MKSFLASVFFLGCVAGQTLWQFTGPLNQARLQTPGTLLKDGRVLLVGSLMCNPGCVSFATAETFDPATSTWSPTAPLNSPHFNHVVALLQSGKVLVAGGYLTPGVLTTACEVFDPANGTWTPTGSLHTARQFHQGAVLPDGRVLITGGLGTDGKGGFSALNSAEIYDPATGQWSSAGTMSTTRYFHTLTALPDGRVLETSGTNATDDSARALANAELYNSSTNAWTQASPNPVETSNAAATLLPDGRVFLAGGYGSNGRPSRGVWIYSPSMDQWTAATAMRAPRSNHSAALLTDGHVLVAGGAGNWVTTEIYDSSSNTWLPSDEFNVGRATGSLTLLADGMRVLAAGGFDIDNNYLTSAEVLQLSGPALVTETKSRRP